MGNLLKLKPGDFVEVRSRDEILATLDDDGCLDGLPFMPEMLCYCGQRLRVFKSAHKTCDSIYYGDGRLMRNAVFLENIRCDGSGHGDCQAYCLIFFKTAWLKRPGTPMVPVMTKKGRDEAWLVRTAQRIGLDTELVYHCQATQHLAATRSFKWYSIFQFVEDIQSGNWSTRDVVRGIALQLVWRLRFVGFGWRAAMWLYARLHGWIYGGPDPHITGHIPADEPTPVVALDLQPGELVCVKSLGEIATTLNTHNRNRGLAYNPEISPFCGGTYRVKQRVTRIIDEKTGRMINLKGPCIILEGGYCMARYHPEALLCPRSIPQYFREAWLTRVAAGNTESLMGCPKQIEPNDSPTKAEMS